MSDFYIRSHYPAINETNIPRNAEIKIYLTKEIKSSSLDYRTISVHDSLYASVPGTIDLDYSDRGTSSGIADVLTFTPSILLESYNTYSVFIHKSPNSIISVDGDSLIDTYKFQFITGSGTIENLAPSTLEQLAIDLQHAIDIENYTLAAELQSYIDSYASGVLPSGDVTAPDTLDYLNIESIYPSNEKANVNLSKLPFIQIQFNDVPNVSGVAIGDYIDVVYKEVLE